jgi:23S rRNA pseudouridine1911/1915/1917 synthase
MPDAVFELLRPFPRQALHAVRIELVHPGSGETVAFTAPLAADFENLLAALRQVAS